MERQQSRVYEAQLRLAAHYVMVVCKACQDYLRGFEGSVAAVLAFNAERVQIEKSAAWLLDHIDHPEAARLFVQMVRDGYQLLYTSVPDEDLQRWLQQSLQAAEQLGDVSAQAKHLYALGWSLNRKGDVQRSYRLIEDAYARAEAVGDAPLMSAILVVRADLARRRGELAAAAEYRERAHAIRRDLGDALGIHHYLYEKGDRAAADGRLDEALQYYEQAYNRAVKAGGYREIARVLTSIGLIYNRQGRHTDALAVYEQALEFSQRIQFPPVIVYTLHALANTSIAMNNLDAGQSYLEQALDLAEQAKLEVVPEILAELGHLAYRYGALEEAQQYLDRALETHRARENNYNISGDLAYLALVYAAQQNFAGAQEATLECLRLTMAQTSEVELLTPIFTAVHLRILRAFSPSVSTNEQTALLHTALHWAGTVLAHPGVDQVKRDTFASFRPALETALGAQRIARLLAEGAQLDLMTVVTDVEAALQP